MPNSLPSTRNFTSTQQSCPGLSFLWMEVNFLWMEVPGTWSKLLPNLYFPVFFACGGVMDDAKFTSIHKRFHFHTTILPWLKFLVDGNEFLVDGSAWNYPFQTRWLYFNQNFFNTLLPGVFTVTSIQSKIISTIYLYIYIIYILLYI